MSTTSSTTTSTAYVRTSSVHLTRRGRALLLVALVAVLFAAFSLGRANTQAASTADGTPAPVVHEQITVQAGESLWTVARRVAPKNDPREVMAVIKRLNDLEGSQLQVGQQLLLPKAA